MTALRFRTRHVHKTVADYVEQALTDAGWVNAQVNFGATAVTFLEFEPQEGGVVVEPNTVAITLGDVPEDLEEELGATYGGLSSCEYPVFVDVYGEDASIAASIADDVRAALKNKVIALVDQATGDPVADGSYIEFETVMTATPPSLNSGPDKRFWRVVKATACTYFIE